MGGLVLVRVALLATARLARLACSCLCLLPLPLPVQVQSVSVSVSLSVSTSVSVSVSVQCSAFPLRCHHSAHALDLVLPTLTPPSRPPYALLPPHTLPHHTLQTPLLPAPPPPPPLASPPPPLASPPPNLIIPLPSLIHSLLRPALSYSCRSVVINHPSPSRRYADTHPFVLSLLLPITRFERRPSSSGTCIVHGPYITITTSPRTRPLTETQTQTRQLQSIPASTDRARLERHPSISGLQTADSTPISSVYPSSFPQWRARAPACPCTRCSPMALGQPCSPHSRSRPPPSSTPCTPATPRHGPTASSPAPVWSSTPGSLPSMPAPTAAQAASSMLSLPIAHGNMPGGGLKTGVLSWGTYVAMACSLDHYQ